jgi:hypothetical protein
MRAFLLAIAAVAALGGAPAHAQPHHHGGYYPQTHVTFGFGFGYPFGYGYGYGYGPYRPYYPWYGYGPTIGVGVQVSPGQAPRKERSSGEQRALKLYVYPAAGQSTEQTSEDRYQCHVWAAGESGHDPTLGAGDRAAADGYTRAFTACMEARNYVVK